MKAEDFQPLLKAAVQAQERGYAPYSKMKVGAALLTSDGSIINGCNVENASYGLTLCAERVAFSTAIQRGFQSFLALAVVSNGAHIPYPCGACRQVMAEFCEDHFQVAVAHLEGWEASQIYTLEDLLPHRFEL